MAGMLVLLAFRFAFTVLPSDTTAATHLAVAASGVLLGLLVLATQDSAFGQIVGFLRIENAIALFELGSTEQLPAAVQAALAAVFLLTVLTLALFLQRLAGVAGDPPLTEAPPTI
jgi:hydrogenase-4 membrane subunit HyfE